MEHKEPDVTITREETFSIGDLPVSKAAEIETNLFVLSLKTEHTGFKQTVDGQKVSFMTSLVINYKDKNNTQLPRINVTYATMETATEYHTYPSRLGLSFDIPPEDATERLVKTIPDIISELSYVQVNLVDELSAVMSQRQEDDRYAP